MTSELPHVDEHVLDIAAPRGATWAAVTSAAERATSSRVARAYARVIRCEPAGGFGVEFSDPPLRHVLAGRHLFSRYRLTFLIEPIPTGSRLHAVTDASFPGVRGSIYRALVVRSGAHAAITRRLLASIARRATG